MTHPPATRSSDPLSSFEAEDRANKYFRQKHKQVILDVIRRYPGLTSMQMASYCHLDRHQIARRTPDLEHDGLIDGIPKKPRTGKDEVRWYPADKQMRLF